MSAASTGRNPGVSLSFRPAFSNSASSSSTTTFRSAVTNVLIVTNPATLLEMAFTISGVPIATGLPNAFCSKNSRTFGTRIANGDGSFTSSAIRFA